jgi:AAA domain-containing protein
MRVASPGNFSPATIADEAVREILRTQWNGERAIRLDSPPGAGKTRVVEYLAVQALGQLDESCMVVTQTNEQAFDLARRLARGYSKLQFTLFLKKDLVVPRDVLALRNLHLVRKTADLPAGPCVVISNATKWSWVSEDHLTSFDCQIVDEAFQLPDYRFHQIAGLAERVVLVGDPGQIAPVVTCEIERWKCDPAGPQIACPRALLKRHPGVRQIKLPVSRRLVPDTVDFIQPAFYPELAFTALSARGERGLRVPVRGAMPIDGAIDLAARGASLVALELPAIVTGEVDEELACAVVSLITRLLQRRTELYDGDTEQRITAAMIGVTCAHVSQVNAIRERLPADLSEVLVETSDRFQGLERPVMVIHHPLSGRVDATLFHLDAGRLCVMASRHRIACFVVSRRGVEDLLLRYAPSGERVLGLEEDSEFSGWSAHLFIARRLRERDRVIRLPRVAN